MELNQVLAAKLDAYDCLFGDRLLRPLVVHGDLVPGGFVILGLNPSTAITTAVAAVSTNEYKRLLLASEDFEPFYRRCRRKLGMGEEGPAHRRINYLIRLLLASKRSVVMSNLYSYPVGQQEKLDQFLAGIAPQAVERLGEHMEWVVETSRPQAVVCLGKLVEAQARERLRTGLTSGRYRLEPIQHPSPRQTHSDAEWHDACADLLRRLT